MRFIHVTKVLVKDVNLQEFMPHLTYGYIHQVLSHLLQTG